MKIRILKRQKIEGEVGTVCEVGPDRASYLLACGAAEAVTETREQVETPEKAEVKVPVKAEKKAAAKTQQAKKPAAKTGKGK